MTVQESITFTFLSDQTARLGSVSASRGRVQLRPQKIDMRWGASAQTDAQGSFCLKIPLGVNTTQPFQIRAVGPLNAPFPAKSLQVEQQTDLTKELQIELPRGVTVCGRVIEQSSGRPVPGVGIGYIMRTDNPLAKTIATRGVDSPDAVTDDQGAFALGVS